MEILTLTLTGMANGGAALGRDAQGRVIFVPYAIPGEQVRVEVVENKGRFAQARLLELLQPAPERVRPRCPHFGVCSGCAFQHIAYPAQLAYKQAIVQDQLARIGGLAQVVVRPVMANPEPYEYRTAVDFSPTPAGGLGFWSAPAGEVIPIRECHIIRPELQALYQDVDLELPNLRKLSLRLGEESQLMALAVDDIEPPALNTDLPIAVAMVLPDGTAANLVGDNYLVQALHGREFRVSAGCFFYPSPPAGDMLIDVVLDYAALTGQETVLDAYCGVGALTAFLAEHAADVGAIEVNPDAVSDATVNLADMDDVTLYEGLVEEILPLLALRPDVVVVDPPPAGLPKTVIEPLVAMAPGRIIYVSDDVATLARDAKHLARRGYRLVEVQPIDMYPQTFQVQTVALWARDA